MYKRLNKCIESVFVTNGVSSAELVRGGSAKQKSAFIIFMQNISYLVTYTRLLGKLFSKWTLSQSQCLAT